MTSPVLNNASSDAAGLEEADLRYLIHPHQLGGRDERVVIVRARDALAWDARGTEFLDMTGGANWLAQVGHGRRELVEAGAAQLADLAYFTSFDVFSNEPSIRLAARLAGLAPSGLERVFYTCGGSEGVDTAIKAARLFHHRRGQPDRTWVLARKFGYHGATYGAGSVTGLDGMHEGIGPNLPHVAMLTPPNPYRADELCGEADLTDFLIRELEEVIERLGPGNIAAMIGEPVMGGGGGVLIPPPDYWPRVRQVLSQHGIVLIADEVITAYGRTGAWFDSVARGMDPDIIVTAKGLTSGYAPLGAVLISGQIGEQLAGQGKFFFHGHTYFGHPVCCAVALANLDLIASEGLVERAALIGQWLSEALAPARSLPIVGDIRVAGAMAGIELVTDPGTRQPMLAAAVSSELRNTHRIITRDYGSTLVLSPPLILARGQADHAAAAIIEVLARHS